MNCILFDDLNRTELLPLVYTRPVCDIRLGILTIREKWEKMLKANTSTLTQNYLSIKFPAQYSGDNLFVNGAVLPDENLVKSVMSLKPGESLVGKDKLIAVRTGKVESINELYDDSLKVVREQNDFSFIQHTWDIFSMNGEGLQMDFKLLTKGRKSAPVSKTNFITGDVNDIFLEEGAIVEYAFLNTNDGPIYVGKGAEIMEGSKVRGGLALCEHAQLKLDAKVYGPTTLGPHVKAGGELNNVVFFGYSNKAHDGFLGNSVIGEWVNIGADTNNSNLKNTYDHVKVWSYAAEKFVDTGLQFCGLIMGDHSKTAINTMFNTGTVVGVACNLFGAGFQRNFISSYSWGGPARMVTYDLEKSFDVARAVMARRKVTLTDADIDILTHIYKLTKK